MVEIIDTKNTKIQQSGGSLGVNIPSAFRSIADLDEAGTEVQIGMLYSEKYGYHIGVWKKTDQPTRNNGE